MSQFLVALFSLVFSVQLMAQDQPNQPPPPNDPGPIEIYLVSYDPKSPPSNPPPTDPADAGGLLIQVADRAGGAGDLLIVGNVFGEEEGVFVIKIDGRGVGLILADWRVVGNPILVGDEQGVVVGPVLVLGDGQGKVVQPNLGTDRISLTCEQALYLVKDTIESDLSLVEFNSELSACEELQSILMDLKFNFNKQPVRETETLL